MSISYFPAVIQPFLQTNFLEKAWGKALNAELVFENIADQETFPLGVGESVTKTRRGLISTNSTNPITGLTLNSSQLDSGLAIGSYGLEQYTYGVSRYGLSMDLDIITDGMGIVKQYATNLMTLAEHAARTKDSIVRNKVYDAGMAGNTVVTATGTTTAVAVDDVRGFQFAYPNGIPTSVSASNSLVVMIGSTNYTVVAVSAGTIGSGTTPNAIAGTLTLSTAVSASDGTAGSTVLASNATTIIREGNVANWKAIGTLGLSLNMILDGVTYFRANRVPTIDGLYNLYCDDYSVRQLFNDPTVKTLFTSAQWGNSTWGRAVYEAPVAGVRIITHNQTLNQTHPTVSGAKIRRPIMIGGGAVIEGTFANQLGQQITNSPVSKAEANRVVIAIRAPLDRAGSQLAQSWYSMFGVVVPTDLTTTPATVATASYAAYKRVLVLEHYTPN